MYFLSGSLDGKLRLWNVVQRKVVHSAEVTGGGRPRHTAVCAVLWLSGFFSLAWGGGSAIWAGWMIWLPAHGFHRQLFGDGRHILQTGCLRGGRHLRWPLRVLQNTCGSGSACGPPRDPHHPLVTAWSLSPSSWTGFSRFSLVLHAEAPLPHADPRFAREEGTALRSPPPLQKKNSPHFSAGPASLHVHGWACAPGRGAKLVDWLPPRTSAISW
jgi:hypothetical protein